MRFPTWIYGFILLLFAAVAEGSVAPRAGWRLAADLLAEDELTCTGNIQAAGAGVSITAVDGYVGPINSQGPYLKVTGDFSVIGEISAATSDSAVFFALYGALQTGTEFWQGIKRLDVGLQGGNLVTLVYTGDSSSPNYRTFPLPGGSTTGPITLEGARIGDQLVFFAGGQEMGRFPDPGLFASGRAYIGFTVSPHNTLTVTGLAAAVPESGDLTLFAPWREQVARSGTGLRDLASARGFVIGADTNPDNFGEDLYRQTLGREYSASVPGNAMKFDATEPAQDVYSYCGADRLVTFAETNHMYVRGHTLLWHDQVPAWVTDGNFSNAELTTIAKNHIETVMGHFKGRIRWWDVVNEGIDDAPPYGLHQSIWAMGLGPDYIDQAFRWAHAADPQAKLIYNDYNNEGMGPKSDAVYELVKGMVSRGVPIDGVGLQSHFQPGNGAPSKEDISANIKRLGDLGLEVQITELDVRLPAPATADELAAQAETYSRVLAACQENDNCKVVLTWGVTDKYTWIDGTFPGFTAPLLFDREYQPKPAYSAFHDQLATTPEVTQVLDGGVVIHAGAAAEVSPGSLADIYGARMAGAAVSPAAGSVPTTLGDVQVTVNGTPAPLLYVSEAQIVFQVPYETAPGIALVVVTRDGVASLPAEITVKQAAPFILTYGANRAVAQNQDYSINAPGNCAAAGSALVAYLIGSGPLDHTIATGEAAPGNPLSAETLATTATVGGATAKVLFAGMTPGFLGLMQVNFEMPQIAAGDAALQVTIGGEASNRPLVCEAP